MPNAARFGERSPAGHTPAIPVARYAQQGIASQGASARSPYLHIRTHSMWAADPDHLLRGQTSGGGLAPTPDARIEGARRPPRGSPPATPQRATPVCKGVRCGAGAGPSYPHLMRTRETGHGLPTTFPNDR